MNRFFYTVLHYLILPALMIRVAIRGVQSPGYANRWWERLGFAPRIGFGGTRPLWVHAVSVGETIASQPLIRALRQRYPSTPLVVTGMTATGAERVHALFGDTVTHVYAPYDLPDIVARFLARVRPQALLIMETELWPNWVAGCEARKIPVLLLNGRMSEKSARGYERFGGLTRPLFQRLAWVAAQTEDDGKRYQALGVRPEALSVTGSIKFDLTVEPSLSEVARDWRSQDGHQLVWVAGSTHDGEESLILEAHRALLSRYPSSLLILVPRHPERFQSVVELVRQSGMRFELRSRNAGQVGADSQVLVGDTMGEMMFFYALSDWAFVGGSLIPRGGHNPLEPAALAKPVIMGREVFNFEQICGRLSDAGALCLVSSEALVPLVLEWASDPAQRLSRGEAGQQVVEANRGALHRFLEGVDRALKVPPRP